MRDRPILTQMNQKDEGARHNQIFFSFSHTQQQTITQQASDKRQRLIKKKKSSHHSSPSFNRLKKWMRQSRVVEVIELKREISSASFSWRIECMELEELEASSCFLSSVSLQRLTLDLHLIGLMSWSSFSYFFYSVLRSEGRDHA